MKVLFYSSDFARFKADFNSMRMVLRIRENVFIYLYT